ASAVLAREEGHPAGAAMVLQTWFGEAGVELAAGRVGEAAAAYDNAAVGAQEARNLVLAVEAVRMSAFCQARLGCVGTAIERGAQTLNTGQRLRREVRGMTTLPLAASDLLRVVDEHSSAAVDAIRTRGVEHAARLNDAFEQHAVLLERSVDRDSL